MSMGESLRIVYGFIGICNKVGNRMDLGKKGSRGRRGGEWDLSLIHI